ncbi:MAG: hypothetical protein WBF43_08135 [Methylocella sp.]
MFIGISTFVVIKLQKAESEAANTRVHELEKESQELRAKNLLFEAAISPRILEQGLTAEELSRFAGLPFVVVSPSDFEPKRTAGQIRFMLLQANWTRFVEPPRHPFAFPDGVTVHVMGRISKQDDPARDAATALVSILNDNGIQSTVGYPMFFLDDHGNPIMPVPVPSPTERSNVLVVEVGPKPLPTSLQLKPSDIPANARGVKIWGNIAE